MLICWCSDPVLCVLSFSTAPAKLHPAVLWWKENGNIKKSSASKFLCSSFLVTSTLNETMANYGNMLQYKEPYCCGFVCKGVVMKTSVQTRVTNYNMYMKTTWQCLYLYIKYAVQYICHGHCRSFCTQASASSTHCHTHDRSILLPYIPWLWVI